MAKKKTKRRGPSRRAESSPTFACGDRAVFTYRRKNRRAKVLVTVTSINYELGSRVPGLGHSIIGCLGYVVRSEHGGELTALPEDLRPGTVLDRILIAIED